MRDFFFQTVLFLAGALIGIISQILQQRDQKRLALLFAFLLMAASFIWAGYELGINKEVQPLIAKSTSSDTPTTSPTANALKSQEPLPTETITPLPTSETSTQSSSSWIMCDDNFSVQGNYFTWIGPNAGTCQISLLDNEFIVGTADRYQENIYTPADETKCVAFLFVGPLGMNISMDKGGGGDFHSASTTYNERYFEDKWIELDNHVDCNCNPGHRCYEKITCTQQGCSTESAIFDPRDKAAQTIGYPNLNSFMSAFEIPAEIKPLIFVCPNEETWCLGVYEKTGQPSFHFKNVMGCDLDGKQENGTSGIPINYDGMVYGFTVRPCK
jgi:hypothetical protein